MEEEEKKIWFVGFSSRLWVPVSFEGWTVMIGFILGLFLIMHLNATSPDAPFSLSQHWPMLVELGALIFAFYRVCKGHVDKRY